ncbi:hypothetical protein [Erythrobacter sanguineus]|uniref:DUF481 domain-containing protein n=2 Tax=Erythrobacter sanguineus TaxID=198312 RepID=A0A1M7SKL9_9SPHN|nr:hypothetical protein [Erythrobacter sanguineus]SHN58985.1 hypothetical protein SAMN02745193_01895 [Erythrobacter sanguineus]
MHYSMPGYVRMFVTLLAMSVLAISVAAPATAQNSGWQLEPDARIEVQTVSAQTTTRDNDLVVDGEAVSVRGQVGLALEKRGVRLRLEADRIEVFRLGEGRRDFARDRFTATIQTDIEKDWELQLQARHFDDAVSVEANDTDEWQGSARLTWEPERAHRVRVQGSWRDREYANGPLAETTGEGPRVDAQYRRRFGRYHYLAFDLRAESIRSDDARRGYERESAGVAYTRPITPDLRIRPAIEVIRTRFDGRLTDAGNQRRDRLVVPEVEVLWWPGRWRIEGEAKYIFAGSNEPIREREGYRLTISVGYAF